MEEVRGNKQENLGEHTHLAHSQTYEDMPGLQTLSKGAGSYRILNRGLRRAVLPYSMSLLPREGWNREELRIKELQILVDPHLNFPGWTLLFTR